MGFSWLAVEFAKADPRQPGHDFLALQITGLWLTAERDHEPSGAGSEALTLDSMRPPFAKTRSTKAFSRA